MSIVATVASNGAALETVMTKAVPLAYVALSRRSPIGSRSISTVSQPRLMPNQSFKQPYSLISPSSTAISNVSRLFSTDRNLDPYERFMRRRGVNCGIGLVREEEAFVIERFGKFSKVLGAGMHLLVPFVDQIAHVHSLKEQTIEILEQPAVTTDNVSITVDGILFVKVIDPERASYGIDNAMYAVTQLAQTVMPRAIAKMSLDKILMRRETLNANIVASINDVAWQWGLRCRSYEIRDIITSAGIKESIFMQALIKKRAAIIAQSMQGNGAQASTKTSLGGPSSMVASALALYKNLIMNKHGNNTSKETSTSTLAELARARVVHRSLMWDIISDGKIVKLVSDITSNGKITKLISAIMSDEKITKLVSDIISDDKIETSASTLSDLVRARVHQSAKLTKLAHDIISNEKITKLIKDIKSDEKTTELIKKFTSDEKITKLVDQFRSFDEKITKLVEEELK